MDSDIYYAYITSPRKDFNYSQRLQRFLIHDFSRRMGLNTTFYVAEIPTPGIFYNLDQKIIERVDLKGFVFYSLELLKPFEKGSIFLKKILNYGYEVWFAVEEQVARKEEDIEPLKLTYDIRKISEENENNIENFYSFLSI